MTTLQALDDRLVAETLAALRAEARDNEMASRVYEVTEQAAAGRYAALARLPVELHLRLVREWSRG
jgi:hypothetical protein